MSLPVISEVEYTNLDDIKRDIDLINKFSLEFYNKNNQIIKQVQSIMTKLDTVIAEEKQNEIYLINLQQKVADNELNNVFLSFSALKDTIETKNKEYDSLIQNNKKIIFDISNTIRKNEGLINNVNDIVQKIEQSTSSIDNKLNK